MEHGQNARHFFGSAHIKRTNAAFANGALHGYGVCQIWKVMIERITRGPRGLQRAVDARYCGANNAGTLRNLRRRHEDLLLSTF